MTGLECLKNELLRRWYTKQQCDSKVVLGVLDIISDSPGKWSDLAALEKDIENSREESKRLWKDARHLENTVTALNLERDKILKELNEVADARYEGVMGYIEQFNAALSQCETPEARDQMKKAQMFVNTVSVDTKYDNTAYIIGLAAILANNTNGPWALGELHKINPKLPHLEVEAALGCEYGWDRKRWSIYEN